MSRQFNEYMVDKFEICGELYSLVEPKNTEEFIQAIETKSRIQEQINMLMHDEKSDGWYGLLQHQKEYIAEYVESLGNFDNTTLANNIVYLVKKNGIRIGELEELLGISAGYISRTIKEDSKKKISIDIVWKIAKLFDMDIRDLTENKMWIPHNNTDLLLKFLDRLYQDTKDNYFAWENDGGVMTYLNEKYVRAGIITEDIEEKCVYHPKHMNPNITWVLNKDIVFIECFDKNKDLVIIPFMAEGKESICSYDFLLMWEEDDSICWQKVFYTSDDPFGHLFKAADKLYDLIETSEYDAKLTPDAYQMITKYVERGRPD